MLFVKRQERCLGCGCSPSNVTGMVSWCCCVQSSASVVESLHGSVCLVGLERSQISGGSLHPLRGSLHTLSLPDQHACDPGICCKQRCLDVCLSSQNFRVSDPPSGPSETPRMSTVPGVNSVPSQKLRNFWICVGVANPKNPNWAFFASFPYSHVANARVCV